MDSVGHVTLTVMAPRRTSIWMSRRGTADPIEDGNCISMNRASPACSTPSLCFRAVFDRLNQPCTKFAFNPRANAMAATEAPGCWHSETTSAFSCALCRRRGAPGLAAITSISRLKWTSSRSVSGFQDGITARLPRDHQTLQTARRGKPARSNSRRARADRCGHVSLAADATSSNSGCNPGEAERQ